MSETFEKASWARMAASLLDSKIIEWNKSNPAAPYQLRMTWGCQTNNASNSLQTIHPEWIPEQCGVLEIGRQMIDVQLIAPTPKRGMDVIVYSFFFNDPISLTKESLASARSETRMSQVNLIVTKHGGKKRLEGIYRAGGIDELGYPYPMENVVDQFNEWPKRILDALA